LNREPTREAQPVKWPPVSKWLNRTRTRFPVVFSLLVVIFARPHGSWWGLAAVIAGQALRLWAAGWLRKDLALTTGGPFRYVRNPHYLGTLVSAAGLLVIVGDWWWAAGSAAAFCVIYVLTIRAEETYLAQAHGQAYAEYRARVPRLVPRLRRFEGGSGKFTWAQAWENREHHTLIAVPVLLLALWLRQRLGLWGVG
jgi:hypothetical protein